MRNVIAALEAARLALCACNHCLTTDRPDIVSIPADMSWTINNGREIAAIDAALRVLSEPQGNDMRTIVLYPGESINIGDTVIKAAHRGGQFVGAPQEVPRGLERQIDEAMKRAHPEDKIALPPAPAPKTCWPPNPGPGWPPYPPIMCDMPGFTPPGDGRCAGQEFPTFSTPYAHA